MSSLRPTLGFVGIKWGSQAVVNQCMLHLPTLERWGKESGSGLGWRDPRISGFGRIAAASAAAAPSRRYPGEHQRYHTSTYLCVSEVVLSFLASFSVLIVCISLPLSLSMAVPLPPSSPFLLATFMTVMFIVSSCGLLAQWRLHVSCM